MAFRFYRELTPEQRLKVKAMFDRREQERRGRGRSEPPTHPAVKK
jgi:Spy/CpxP family protein refolding chaperone